MLKVGTTPRDGVFDSLQKPSDHAGLVEHREMYDRGAIY